MSFIFSRALVEACLQDNCLGIDASALLSGSHTPPLFLPSDKTTDFSRLSRFGMTFGHLTADHGAALLTSWQAASRAKTSALRGGVQESTANGLGCGRTWRASLAKFDPASSSWKTAQPSLLGASGESSVTWPRSGMTAGGECWELPMLERRTSGTGSGLWPTPSGVSNGGRNHVVGRLDEWGGSSNPFRGTAIASVRCASFEEWMMGWPTGWSGLTPLETGKCPSVLPKHSGNSQPLLSEAQA